METTAAHDVKTWSVDPTHTTLQFAVKHMIITETRGDFDKFAINVQSNGSDFENAKVELTIDVNSINTNLADRDAHLRSPDFFDAAQFPEIRFVSASLKKKDDENYELEGNMTIKGITKPMTFQVNYGGQVVDPWGNLRAGFHIHGSIDRFDFGLTWNSLLETGGAVVAKKVRLEATIELVAAK